VAKAMVEG
jgi:hypothetical protein